MQLADLAELRMGVEVAIADLAAARIDDVGTAGLDEALAREANATDAQRVEAVHDLHAAVAAAAQNRVLHLVALVLIRLSRLYQIERLAPKAQKQIRAEVFRTHEGIAGAIEDGDRELAATACAGTSRRSATSALTPTRLFPTPPSDFPGPPPERPVTFSGPASGPPLIRRRMRHYSDIERHGMCADEGGRMGD